MRNRVEPNRPWREQMQTNLNLINYGIHLYSSNKDNTYIYSTISSAGEEFVAYWIACVVSLFLHHILFPCQTPTNCYQITTIVSSCYANAYIAVSREICIVFFLASPMIDWSWANSSHSVSVSACWWGTRTPWCPPFQRFQFSTFSQWLDTQTRNSNHSGNWATRGVIKQLESSRETRGICNCSIFREIIIESERIFVAVQINSSQQWRSLEENALQAQSLIVRRVRRDWSSLVLIKARQMWIRWLLPQVYIGAFAYTYL